MSKQNQYFDRSYRSVSFTQFYNNVKKSLNSPERYLNILEYLIKLKQIQKYNFENLFQNEGYIQKILSELKYRQLIPLVLRFFTGGKKKLFQKYAQNQIFQMNQQFKQYFTLKQQLRTKIYLNQQFYQKIYTFYELYSQLHIQNKLKLNLIAKWIVSIKGQNSKQLILIKKLLNLLKQYNIKYIEFSNLFNYLKSTISGSGNIVLILTYMGQVRQLTQLLLKSFNNDIGFVLKQLCRQCLPLKILKVAFQIVRKCQYLNQTKRIINIFDEFYKGVLFIILPKSKYYDQISEAIQLIMKTNEIRTRLNIQQFRLFTQQLNQMQKSRNYKLWLTIIQKMPNKKQYQQILQNKHKKQIIKKQNDIGTRDLDLQKKNIDMAQSLRDPKTIKIESDIQRLQNDLAATSQIFTNKSKKTEQKVVNKYSKKSKQNQQIIFECQDYIGIPNIGNTCYINSFLQCLFHYKQFRQLILGAGSSNELIQIIKKIFESLYKKKKVLPKYIEALKSNISSIFNNDSQQDAMQFGRQIIQKLITNEQLKPQIKRIFEIKITQTFICKFNHNFHVGENQQFFLILSFQNPKIISKAKIQYSNGIKISQMIESYFNQDIRTGKFQCSSCKKQIQQFDIRYKISLLPKFWIITLSRFTYDKNTQSKKKIFDKVTIEDYLHLNQIKTIRKQATYKLKSFIIHMGHNAESGHYQAYVRHPTEAQWLNFDDSYVTSNVCENVIELMENFNEAETPYILFYERIK